MAGVRAENGAMSLRVVRTHVGSILQYLSSGPAGYRGTVVRPGSGRDPGVDNYSIGFSKVRRLLRPPRLSTAAGGAVLPERNDRKIGPRNHCSYISCGAAYLKHTLQRHSPINT